MIGCGARRGFLALLCVGAALAPLGYDAASAQGPGAETSPTVETLRIPMREAGPAGLDALVMTPGGPGRHPLVLLSHGSPREASDRPRMTPRGMLPQMTAFARRGFVVAAVMRRGYGTSAGGWAEDFGPCDGADYVAAGRAGAADLRAALAALAERPDVDPTKILAVGHSAGGFATIALAEDPPPGLVAAISFAGGRGSLRADSVCSEDGLIAAMRTFGSRGRVPMLWVYAENDHFFGPQLAAKLVSAFRAGGGTATFVAAPVFGQDGHALFSGTGRAVWSPIVDAFLETRRLPTLETAPARAAAILEPPPRLGVGGQRDFRTYREAASHKAFAVSAAGAYAWRTARTTIAEAVSAAMKQCEAVGREPCHIYAIDDARADE